MKLFIFYNDKEKINIKWHVRIKCLRVLEIKELNQNSNEQKNISNHGYKDIIAMDLNPKLIWVNRYDKKWPVYSKCYNRKQWLIILN